MAFSASSRAQKSFGMVLKFWLQACAVLPVYPFFSGTSTAYRAPAPERQCPCRAPPWGHLPKTGLWQTFFGLTYCSSPYCPIYSVPLVGSPGKVLHTPSHSGYWPRSPALQIWAANVNTRQHSSFTASAEYSELSAWSTRPGSFATPDTWAARLNT